MINNRVYEYIMVEGNGLKETNDNTRQMWKEADERGYNEIIEVTEKGKEKRYLVDTSLYHNIIQAAQEGRGMDPYGIPNVNFTLVERGDDRWEEFRKQRLEHGFDDSETWSLSSTFTKFILPRLKRFRDVTEGYPASFPSLDAWKDVIGKMILSFEYLDNESLGEEEGLPARENIENRAKIIDEGLGLFAKYYDNLWW